MVFQMTVKLAHVQSQPNRVTWLRVRFSILALEKPKLNCGHVLAGLIKYKIFLHFYPIYK
jgi:hypothetical protein